MINPFISVTRISWRCRYPVGAAHPGGAPNGACASDLQYLHPSTPPDDGCHAM